MLKKGLYITDIHFGRKSDSPTHNQDCVDFITWVCDEFKKDPELDYVAFLGDWFESRTSINISTLDYAYKCAKLLNSLNVPVYFCIGNHDMAMRHSREIYSTVSFNEFSNFILVHEGPMVVPPSVMMGGAVFVPFLRKDEYEKMSEFVTYPLWAGHFEFQGFVLTGYSFKLKEGPDINQFKDVETILSGHFHKRQKNKNTQYIGNAFPMDFGDANDNARGYAVYDHTTKQVEYHNWLDCPKYIKVKLSDVRSNIEKYLCNKSHIDIDIDESINYEQLSHLEDTIRSTFEIRSLKFDETSKFIDENIEMREIDEPMENITTNDMIVNMLDEVDEEKFSRSLLIDIYRNAQ